MSPNEPVPFGEALTLARALRLRLRPQRSRLAEGRSVNLYMQQHLADPARADGHTAEGTAGDCLRAAAATVLHNRIAECDPADLRHYGQELNWWAAMRLDARRYGVDWAYADDPEQALREWGIPEHALLIADGPSPRGPFGHAVVVDTRLALVHDPHPSGAGLERITGLFVVSEPYEPAPSRLALCGVA